MHGHRFFANNGSWYVNILSQDLREAFDIDADIWRMKRLLLTSAVSAYTETINSAYDVPSLRE